MSKLFKKNKGPSMEELREQARQDYELAQESQMSKEDAEGWRQEMQADQLAKAMPIFQQLIDTGMSANENNPIFQKLGGQATERPSLMDLIGGQMQGGEQQQQEPQPQQQQQQGMGGQYADQIAAFQQQQAQQQAPQQAAMGQQGGMGQQAQMGQQGQMGQPQDQQQQGGMAMNGSVPSMSDINNMLKSFNINNHV
jgi:hypothetical protein